MLLSIFSKGLQNKKETDRSSLSEALAKQRKKEQTAGKVVGCCGFAAERKETIERKKNQSNPVGDFAGAEKTKQSIPFF